MNNWKNRLLVVALILALAITLTACGGNDTLEGTYVIEGDENSGISITFTEDNFSFVMPYTEIDIEHNLPGNFVLTGNFSIDDDNSVIHIYVNETALYAAVSDMIDVLMDHILDDPEFAEAMQNPAFAEIAETYIAGMKSEMHDGLFQMLLGDFTGVGFRFDGSFDRLYDDTSSAVFVRQ